MTNSFERKPTDFSAISRLRDSADSIAGSYTGNLDSSWSNETFSAYFCGNLTDETQIFHWNPASDSNVRFLIPDCFFDYKDKLLGFYGSQFILKGSIDHPDPLARLGTAFPSLSSLRLRDSSILTNGSSSYICNWNSAFQALLKLSDLAMISVPLNCTLPSTLPSKICSLTLNDAGINGTIPSGLFSNRSTSITSFYQLSLHSNFLEGSIPSSLLHGVPLESAKSFWLDLSNNDLTGSIPEDLFGNRTLSSIAQLTFYVASNSLNGSAGAWISGFQPVNGTLTLFQVDLSGNQLSGSINSFPSIFFKTAFWTWNMDNNRINGSIPSDIFPAGSFSTGGTTPVSLFRFSASNNHITGLVSASLFNHGTEAFGFNQFVVTLNDNEIEGNLPPGLMSSLTSTTKKYVHVPIILTAFFEILTHLMAFQSLAINLANNNISGPLPSDLLLIGSTASAVSISDVSIDLSHNKISGSLPSGLFEPISWNATRSFKLALNHNLVTGDLPITLLNHSTTPRLTSFRVSLNDNPNLNGSIPASFLDSINPKVAPSSQYADLSISLVLSNTALTGTLTLPNFTPRSQAQSTSLSLQIANANLRRIDFDANARTILSTLDLSGNDLLIGTLPAGLFSDPSVLSTLLVGNTALGGPLPDASNIMFKALDLSSTHIDFCPTSGPLVPKASFCNLNDTNAYQCQQNFPVCSTTIGAKESPNPCPLATRPSLDFVCIGTTWTLYGNFTAPTFIITGQNNVSTIIFGNVESTSLVLGKGSSLIIHNGCASNLSTVTIQLESDDLNSIESGSTRTLLSVDAGLGCSNLSTIALIASINGVPSCKKVSVTRIGSASQLVALFSIDSSGCAKNTWWIVVVAVLVPIVVIALIIIPLVIFVRPVRECIIPYSKRRNPRAASVEQY